MPETHFTAESLVQFEEDIWGGPHSLDRDPELTYL